MLCLTVFEVLDSDTSVKYIVDEKLDTDHLESCRSRQKPCVDSPSLLCSLTVV